MLDDPFRQPSLVASFGIIDHSAFNSGANDCFESRTWLYDFGVGRKKGLIFAIKNYKFVVRIV